MLTFEDCIEMSEVPEDVIEAIACHEHIPMMIALEMGAKLIHTSAGQGRIRRFIQDDIDHFRHTGDRVHTQHFEEVLERFETTHPGF